MSTMMNATSPFGVHTVWDYLAEKSDSTFCDVHHYHPWVKDVHGAALSTVTLVFCLCYTARVAYDRRASPHLLWICQCQCITVFLAAMNHVTGNKFNDLCLILWSIFVQGPAFLEFYEKRGGGAWFYEVVPKSLYKVARFSVLFHFVHPLISPFTMGVLVYLPSQPKVGTVTSRLANLFVSLALGPILMELVYEGMCPYYFPVHALSDACVLFTIIWQLITLHDVDLAPAAAKSKSKSAVIKQA